MSKTEEKKIYLNDGPDDPNTNWLQISHRMRLERERKAKKKRAKDKNSPEDI